MAVLLILGLSSCSFINTPAHGSLSLGLPNSRALVEAITWRITGDGPGSASFSLNVSTTQSQVRLTDLVQGLWTITVEGLDEGDTVIFSGQGSASVGAGISTVAITVVAIPDGGDGGSGVIPVVPLPPELYLSMSIDENDRLVVSTGEGFLSYTWYIDGVLVDGDPYTNYSYYGHLLVLDLSVFETASTVTLIVEDAETGLHSVTREIALENGGEV